MNTDPRSWSSSRKPKLSACYEDAVAAFERLHLSWTLVGAAAALVYRTSTRETTDVDFLAEYADELAPDLQDSGYDVVVQRDEGEAYLLRATSADGTVDVLFPVTEYQRVALGRSVDHVLAVEDVLVHKLIAGRRRDRSDILSILANDDIEIDDEYVASWAREWNVDDLWEELKQEGRGNHDP